MVCDVFLLTTEHHEVFGPVVVLVPVDVVDHLSGAYQHLKVAVINYESTWRDEIFEALLAYDADLIICDESQRIKTHDAAQSKAMHQLGDRARYKLILSGTPVQNQAVDIFSQYRFLDPSIFGDNTRFSKVCSGRSRASSFVTR